MSHTFMKSPQQPATTSGQKQKTDFNKLEDQYQINSNQVQSDIYQHYHGRIRGERANRLSRSKNSNINIGIRDTSREQHDKVTIDNNPNIYTEPNENEGGRNREQTMKRSYSAVTK